jgi:chemotaxis family two-component system response regulator Rcp1
MTKWGYLSRVSRSEMSGRGEGLSQPRKRNKEVSENGRNSIVYEAGRDSAGRGQPRRRGSGQGDGVEAMAFLRRKGKYKDVPRPDLVLLDLNLPKKDGREVLAEIKTDEDLKRIPVVILTTSREEEDILKSYNLHANCYITKPIDLNQFMIVVKSIEDFWLTIVRLPPNGAN